VHTARREAGGAFMKPLRIKICGLCSAADARIADAAGADYIGVILTPRSKRSKTLKEARPIYEAIDDAQRVGVFVDEPIELLQKARQMLALDVLQLHGMESPAYVKALRESSGVTIWKALRPRSGDEMQRGLDEYADVAHGILLDGWSSAGAGGTGAKADWSMAAKLRTKVPQNITFTLAGGLDPENIAGAVETVRPDVVDVSSGVETMIGAKSRDLINAFIEAARAAGQNRRA
jgi:phosphoribosylanthranilate isomerase